MSEQIKETEIMIGNRFHVQPHNQPVQIIEIKSGRSDYKCYVRVCSPNLQTNFATEIKNIRPIPLTEDILLKCGFKRNRFDVLPTFRLASIEMSLVTFYDEDPKRVSFYFSEWKLSGLYGDDLIYFKSSPSIKYLHQLQNLFKSITQTDLKVEV